jgi:hypothetical protein
VKSGAELEASLPFPDFAEPVIGPATSGRARWLNPGYYRGLLPVTLRCSTP